MGDRMAMTQPPPEEKPVSRRQRAPWLSAVPLLSLIVLAYIVFAAGGADFAMPRFSPVLPSGGVWEISLGDALLACALLVLFFEVLKSARSGGSSVVDHALSTIVLVVCIILFLVWDKAATSLFFLITLTTLIDVIAGFSVTIHAARRD